MPGSETRRPRQDVRSPAEWERRITAHEGLTTQISQTFLDRITPLPQRTKDRLTGLPVDSDKNRRQIVRRFSQAVRTGENFAVVYADLDNLKTANYIDRLFGDQMIRVGAANVCNSLAELDLEGVTMHVVRPSKAADETIVWLFGLTDAQKDALKASEERLNKPIGKYTEGTTTFEASNSATVVSSDDELFAENLASAREFLSHPSRREHLPWKLYNQFTGFADDKTSITKVRKDITRIELEETGARLEESHNVDRVSILRQILKDTLGGSRVSRPLQGAAFRMIEQLTRMEGMGEADMRQCIGVDMDLADWTNTFVTNPRGVGGLLVDYFDFIPHREYEEEGFAT